MSTPVEQLRPERRRRDQRRLDADRPQVGVAGRGRHAARRAPARDGPTRPGRTTSGRRPPPAGSRRPSGRPRGPRRGCATPKASIAAPPTSSSDQSTPKPKRVTRRVDDPPGRGDDLRPDPVTRDRRDAVPMPLHGSDSPCRGETNATDTPLISAPWSLLTATR